MIIRDTTLVAISSVRVQNHLDVLSLCKQQVHFEKTLLLTDVNIYREDLEVVEIPRISSIDEYSRFIVYDLHKYINTEYVLLVQDDGYIINKDSWLDEFYEYDYIGAPWALPSDNFSYRDTFGNIIRVGNGGFSFRSKKLLSLPSKLKLEWKPYFGYYNEDGFFCCHNRDILKKNGCKFAPIDVAKYFSHERTDIPEVQGIKPFGFHGKSSKWRII